MGTKLYVGNLPYGFGDVELRALFQAHGPVRSAQVALDRVTGRSRGFGLVEMQAEGDARAAVAGLNGKAVNGRPLTVRADFPKEKPGPGRPPRPADRRGREVRKKAPALARRLRKPRAQDAAGPAAQQP